MSGFNDLAYGENPDSMIRLPGVEFAFKTRVLARAFLKATELSPEQKSQYTVTPVYGAWRVDPKCGETYEPGHLRFRTKREAEGFARDTYGVFGEGYRVLLHDDPVPEGWLYTPVKFE